MPYPLTHLLVADELLKRKPRSEAEAAQFLLGSLAPDAVHYRECALGPTKKITHLCPASDEPWGKVTENDKWVQIVKSFDKIDPLAEGYAVHCLTDLCNNKTLWLNFRTGYPQEAAKGYKSGYYDDLRNIDARLFLEHLPEHIFRILAKAKATDMPGLVTAEEITAIQENILYKQYNPPPATPSQDYTYVTFNETQDFIQHAADFIEENL